MQAKFIIPGQPQSKGRPIFSKHNNFTSVRTPEKTASYENLVKLMYKQANGSKYLQGELSVTIDCFFAIPVSTSKKQKIEMINKTIRPQTKPDVDNIAKVVCDALNGIAYADDKQIVFLQIRKYYAEIPSVEVTIENYEEVPLC